VVDEPTVVWATPSGAPERLEWRGRRWLVCARPVPWIDRVPWWLGVPRAPKGGAAGLVEQPMWRVQAMDSSGSDVVGLDLAVGTTGDWWRVTRVYE